MSPRPDIDSSSCYAEPMVMKRKSSASEKENKKHFKLDESEDHPKVGNLVQVLAEQERSLKVVSDVAKKKPKTPAERVLVSLGAELGCGNVLSNYLPKSQRKFSDSVAAFMFFVFERQNMYELKSSGAEQPYSHVKVMVNMWFTNMYRELDRGTMFFRKQILSEHNLKPACHKEVIFKAVVYRLINKIETFQEFGKIPCIAEWKQFKKFLQKKRTNREIIFTNAHQNMGLTRFCDTISDLLVRIGNFFTQNIVEAESLEECFLHLKSINNIGDFFAWQICCDFLELRLINFDENTWTCLGPGAKEGLRRIFAVKSVKDELPLAKHLTKIMDYSFKALGISFPYFMNRKLTLKNVEHALCEYDKYFRAATNQPTRERKFLSRTSLDSTTCTVCKKTATNNITRCVLCGTCYHLACLGPTETEDLIEGKWWLCLKCHNLEFQPEEEFSESHVYHEVQHKYKIRPSTVDVKMLEY